tara:strand:+ start:3950 stop:4420 length:471 start_codon:yes stop_codon:yes gene_type:complete
VSFSGNWDGSSISYEPPPRMQTRTGLIAAGILIVAGAALLVGAVIGQQFQSQARNSGEAAVGVVSSVDDGRATIEYGVGDQRYSVRPEPQVPSLSGIAEGSSVNVRFDPEDPTDTFVERIDILEPLTPLLAVGGLLLLIGLFLARFPPRSPERCAP